MQAIAYLIRLKSMEDYLRLFYFLDNVDSSSESGSKPTEVIVRKIVRQHLQTFVSNRRSANQPRSRAIPSSHQPNSTEDRNSEDEMRMISDELSVVGTGDFVKVELSTHALFLPLFFLSFLSLLLILMSLCLSLLAICLFLSLSSPLFF